MREYLITVCGESNVEVVMELEPRDVQLLMRLAKAMEENTTEENSYAPELYLVPKE